MSGRNRVNRQDSISTSLKITTPPTGIIILQGPENWRNWRHQVSTALRKDHQACLDALPAENIRNNRQHPDMIKDHEAYERITNSLDQYKTYTIIVGTTYAKQAWDALHEVFGDQGVHEIVGLLQSLFELKQEHCTGLRDYVLKFQDMATQLATMGEKLGNQVLAVLMLQGLGPEYKELRRVIQSKTTKMVLHYEGNSLLFCSVFRCTTLKLEIAGML